MAVKPKKTKTSIKKKSVRRNGSPKRKTRKSRKKSHLKKNFFVVLGVLLIISMVVFGYFLGNNSTASKHKTVYSKTYPIDQNNGYSTKELLADLSNRELTKPKVIKKEKPATKLVEMKKVEKKHFKEKAQKRVVKEKKAQQKKKVVLTPAKGKPQLVIVIDDVSSTVQLKRIQSTGLKLTPSIFPPSELSMSSHKLATSLDHYMIHLPMESGNTKFNTQYKTLMVKNSVDTIEQRVKEIRRLFPKAKYINNHTGSVFTDDYSIMYKLYSALRNEGFVFVDSRTTGSSKVRKIARQFGDAYVGRDIFIDNEHTIEYIHNQLKEAVTLAKRRGYAVAIGHPHKITMQALKSAETILNDVELVYIDEIYKEQ